MLINELKLMAQALKGGVREKVQLATKCGCKIAEGGPMEIHGEPEYVRAACEASLKRLEIDYIDLYYIHRIDQKIPIEVTVCFFSLFSSTILRFHIIIMHAMGLTTSMFYEL